MPAYGERVGSAQGRVSLSRRQTPATAAPGPSPCCPHARVVLVHAHMRHLHHISGALERTRQVGSLRSILAPAVERAILPQAECEERRAGLETRLSAHGATAGPAARAP